MYMGGCKKINVEQRMKFKMFWKEKIKIELNILICLLYIDEEQIN